MGNNGLSTGSGFLRAAEKLTVPMRLRGVPSGLFYTLALALGLLVAFIWATYLSYWGGQSVSNAFQYQTSVVSAQRDADILANAQGKDVSFLEKLLDSDLLRIDSFAETEAERSPPFGFPATSERFGQLDVALKDRQALGEARFDKAIAQNGYTRNLSNALFAIVALLFTLVQARLRRRLQEGRSVVESLQRAFLSRRIELPNVSLGTVLISATAGSEVGGDLFDVYAIDDRYGSFLIADVSGKGIDAAVDTAFIKYSIRTLVGESRDPGAVLTKFAALFERNIERSETFVVLFLGVIDTLTGQVTYASAGHEPAWLRHGREVRRLEPTGPIVGIMSDVEYESSIAQLVPGDSILISTDGLTESRNARGVQLGAEGVAGWFREIDGDAQASAETIVQRLRRRSRRITDDLAILIVRYSPKLVPAVSSRVVAATGTAGLGSAPPGRGSGASP
jgi:serine phosphatase RsbU (regulator of sigma subunit)